MVGVCELADKGSMRSPKKSGDLQSGISLRRYCSRRVAGLIMRTLVACQHPFPPLASSTPILPCACSGGVGCGGEEQRDGGGGGEKGGRERACARLLTILVFTSRRPPLLPPLQPCHNAPHHHMSCSGRPTCACCGSGKHGSWLRRLRRGGAWTRSRAAGDGRAR